MLSMVCSSVATGPFDEANLATLLMNGRANNRRLGLTGFLLFKDGHFLLTLEGEEEVVRDRSRVIRADPRHTNIVVLAEEHLSWRRFPAWSMGYEAVTDVRADDIPGYRSTFEDISRNLTPTVHTHATIRHLLDWFQTRDTQPLDSVHLDVEPATANTRQTKLTFNELAGKSGENPLHV